MTSTASEAARLERLEARADIEDLVHRYARAVRNSAFADIRPLFVPEGTFEIRQMIAGEPASLRTLNLLRGRDALVDYLIKGGGKVCPMIHNLLIEVTGDTATSTAVMRAVVWSAGAGIAPSTMGEYTDSYKKSDGVWCFTGRIFTMLRAPEKPT